MNIIDSHIHLDLYKNEEKLEIVKCLEQDHLKALISVSMNLASAKENLVLANKYSFIYPAFGFHPEQSLPTEEEFSELMEWIQQHQSEMVAVGEVGLPYYLRKENGMDDQTYQSYINLLEQFIILAKKLNKPIILHAVYDDAPIVCGLLEKHHISTVHFHWFKGDTETIKRMIKNGYYISITPEVLYKEKIMKLVKQYPLEQMMVETDGPWPFEGPFQGKQTHPLMIHESIRKIAELKQASTTDVYHTVFENTIRFYRLKL